MDICQKKTRRRTEKGPIGRCMQPTAFVSVALSDLTTVPA